MKTILILFFLLAGVAASAQTTSTQTFVQGNAKLYIFHEQKIKTLIKYYEMPKDLVLDSAQIAEILETGSMEKSANFISYYFLSSLYPLKVSWLDTLQKYKIEGNLIKETPIELKLTKASALWFVVWVLFPAIIFVYFGWLNAKNAKQPWKLLLYYFSMIGLFIFWGTDLDIGGGKLCLIFLLWLIFNTFLADLAVLSSGFLLFLNFIMSVYVSVLCGLSYFRLGDSTYNGYILWLSMCCILGFIVREVKLRRMMKNINAGEIIDKVFLEAEQPGPHHPSSTEGDE